MIDDELENQFEELYSPTTLNGLLGAFQHLREVS